VFHAIDFAALLVAALQVGDMATTLMAMSRGAHEANPLVAAMIRLMGKIPGLGFVKAMGVGFTIWLWWMDAHFILWALALIYLWVCAHNIGVWRRRGKLLEMTAMYHRLAQLESARAAAGAGGATKAAPDPSRFG